jgi:hypothetical protein
MEVSLKGVSLKGYKINRMRLHRTCAAGPHLTLEKQAPNSGAVTALGSLD